MALAFANKAIDAAIYNEPWATQQEQLGIVKKVVYTDDVDPNGHVAGVLFSETFARNTPAARNYLVAYLRGVRDYWDAYDGRIDFQVVVDVLQKHTPLKDENLIRKIPPTGQNPHGYLDPAKLAAYQDWFADRALIPQKADIAKAYDQSFVDYANAVLGPYQPVENPRRPS
jgi:ABC-type nitrate/sulfonate/bicarbonate transport system substrate-binding protein